MEMVKVDIQKLQLLNDRIAQTIDALNQVRLSVHGIQHTTAPTAGFTPWGQPQYGNPYMQVQNPFVQGPFLQTPFVQPPSGWQTPFTTGIAHSTLDPYWQVRAQQSLQQTFPFAQYGWTPNGTYGSF